MERGKSLGVGPGLDKDSQINIDSFSFSIDQIDVVFIVDAGNDLGGDGVDFLEGKSGEIVGLLDKLFNTKVEVFLDGGVESHELFSILLDGTAGDTNKGAGESESENEEDCLH